jgi:DNA-directed RNA polymerase specialized sigma24 family protein
MVKEERMVEDKDREKVKALEELEELKDREKVKALEELEELEEHAILALLQQSPTREAREQMWSRYESVFTGFIARRAPNEAIREVLHNACERIWRLEAEDWRKVTKLRSYLLTIVRNCRADWFRQQRRLGEREGAIRSLEDRPAPPSDEDDALEPFCVTCIQGAWQTFKQAEPAKATVIECRVLLDWKPKDIRRHIKDIYGVGDTRDYLYRARQAWREHLIKYLTTFCGECLPHV